MAASNAKDGKPYRHAYHFAGFVGGGGRGGGLRFWADKCGMDLGLRFEGPRALSFGVRVERSTLTLKPGLCSAEVLQWWFGVGVLTWLGFRVWNVGLMVGLWSDVQRTFPHYLPYSHYCRAGGGPAKVDAYCLHHCCFLLRSQGIPCWCGFFVCTVPFLSRGTPTLRAQGPK